jgi:hypothetical protein
MLIKPGDDDGTPPLRQWTRRAGSPRAAKRAKGEWSKMTRAGLAMRKRLRQALARPDNSSSLPKPVPARICANEAMLRELTRPSCLNGA